MCTIYEELRTYLIDHGQSTMVDISRMTPPLCLHRPNTPNVHRGYSTILQTHRLPDSGHKCCQFLGFTPSMQMTWTLWPSV